MLVLFVCLFCGPISGTCFALPSILNHHFVGQWNSVRIVVYRMVKRIRRAATGRCAIERICGGEHDNGTPMSLQFLREWGKSRQLATTFANHAGRSDMDVEAAATQILEMKRLSSHRRRNESQNLHEESSASDVVPLNLKRCLRIVQAVNGLKAHIHSLQATQFDSSNAAHERPLEDLWSALLPGVTREGGRITREWGRIGFQQRDPTSDFRGGGLLGLHQLLHVAQSRNTSCRRMLQEPVAESARYPWACAGINVTFRVFQLLQSDNGQGLDLALFRIAEQAYSPLMQNAGDSEDRGGVDGNSGQPTALVSSLLNGYNEIYADLFEEFHRQWVASSPENVLSFGPVFDKSMADCISDLKQRGHVRRIAVDNPQRLKSE